MTCAEKSRCSANGGKHRGDRRGARENKNGVVWHNDAGEKDETVFNLFIGTQSLKSPVFFRGKSGPIPEAKSHKPGGPSKSYSIGFHHGGEGLCCQAKALCARRIRWQIH